MNSEFVGAESGSLNKPGHVSLLGLLSKLFAAQLSLGMFLAVAALVCVLIWACVWVYVVSFPMAYQDRNYPLSVAKEELLAQCTPGEIAVFGDSRTAAAIIPKAMDVPVVNLAFAGASPVENYFLIKRYLGCPGTPKLIVLAQSPGMYAGPEFFWSTFAQKNVLSVDDIKEVQAEARRLKDDELLHIQYPGGVPYTLLPELYAMRFPPLYFASILDGYVFGRWKYNEAAFQDIVSASGHVLFGIDAGNNGVAEDARIADWKVTPLVNLYMARTVDLLESRHVPFAIVTMPLNETTCRQLPPGIQGTLSGYLEQVTRNDPGAVFVNSQISCWPDRFFGDPMHFNQTGALAYSKMFEGLMLEALQAPVMKDVDHG